MREPRWTGVVTVALVCAAAVVGVYVGGATLAGPREAGPTLALASPPTPRPTRSLAPTSAPDDLQVFPLGPIPTDSRFLLAGDPGDERLLLLDLGAKQVRLAAHFRGFGAHRDARVIELTANADQFVIHLRSDRAEARVYFIRPATGSVRSITIPHSESPRISPDGSLLAVSRNSQDPALKGLWLLNTSDGQGRRVTVDDGRRATRAVQWSSDGRRLAALLDFPDFKRQVVVLDTAGNMTPPIAPASDARWRGTELLYWEFNTPGSVGVYDPISTQTRAAFPIESGVIIARAEARPRSTDMAVRERRGDTLPKIVVYDGAGKGTVRMDDAQWVFAFWWSPDGTRLYAWISDNDTTHVRELLTNEPVVSFCFRKKIELPCGR